MQTFYLFLKTFGNEVMFKTRWLSFSAQKGMLLSFTQALNAEEVYFPKRLSCGTLFVQRENRMLGLSAMLVKQTLDIVGN